MSQPVVQTRTPVVTTTPVTRSPASFAGTSAPKPRQATTHEAKRAKARKVRRDKVDQPKRRAATASNGAARPAAAVRPGSAVAAVRRVAHVLGLGAPTVVKPADRGTQSLAAAALLLLVAAGVSVLRLSMRMSDELLRSRPR